jgi:hypothetical protein
LKEALKEADKVHVNFCKKLMELPSSAANRFVEINLVERAGEASVWDG